MFNLKRLSIAFIALTVSLSIGYTAYAGSYTVQAGDSLYTIGKLFNTDSGTLFNTNGLSGNVIFPGQKLDVPSVTYTVKSGDSLYLIAKRYGLVLSALRKANNQWNDTIHPGQNLILPKPASTINNSTRVVPISYTSSDLDLLARLITAEADGEPYNAKVAVGAVVLNRVQDQRFPNTISSVIYQKDSRYYQFTPVENGWINRPSSQDAKNAAYDSLHGIDPTKGAVYYFDDSTTNTWIWSRPIAIRIDKMVFTY